MDQQSHCGDQQDFRIESSRNGQPLTDDGFRRLFESGRLDGFLLLQQTMGQTRMAMSLADATRKDMPLVYVNEAFCKLTGYEREDIVGRDCGFLQGPKSDPMVVKSIRECVKNEGTQVFEILNYRKDGTTFWNALHMGPVFDAKGKLQYYFVSQWDVSNVHAARAADQQAKLVQHELNHRTLNIFAVVSSLITLSGIGVETPKEAMHRARERVAALGAAHRASLEWAVDRAEVQLGALIDTLIEPYVDNAEGNVVLEGTDVVLPPDTVTAIGIAIHELATNSMKYGYLGGKALDASLKWTVEKTQSEDPVIKMVWREVFQDNKGPSEASSDGTGSRIMRALLQPYGGDLERVLQDDTLEVRLSIPIVPPSV